MEYSRSFAMVEAFALIGLAAWLFYITYFRSSDQEDRTAGEETPRNDPDEGDNA